MLMFVVYFVVKFWFFSCYYCLKWYDFLVVDNRFNVI